MCFPLYDCFFCIRLDTAAKVIGIVYVFVSISLTTLFGVPVALAWQAIPISRAYFYATMAASSVVLFVSAVLLVIGAFARKPSLMQPWVVSSLCVSVPLMLLSVTGMVTIPMRAINGDVAAEESTVISTYFVHGLLLFYFSSVVNSRRRQLERQETGEDLKGTERLVYPSTIQNQYCDQIA